MKDLRGKRALVTGAASGIGQEIALALARQRVELFLVDINRAGLAAVAAEAGREGVEVMIGVGDLARPDEISRLVACLSDRWGGLDILVNNAGVAYYGPTEQMTRQQWDRLLAVNLHAPIQFTRELLPALLDQYEAHILNVCSIAGLVAGPRLAAYQVSKFGLVGFSESLRAEYGGRGLGVTALCPGLVRTDIFRSSMTAPNRLVPRPPSWVCTSPQRVADRAVRAIRRNQGLVVVTPMAHFLWAFKRLSPWLLDALQQFHRHRHRPAPLEAAQAEQPATIPFPAAGLGLGEDLARQPRPAPLAADCSSRRAA